MVGLLIYFNTLLVFCVTCDNFCDTWLVVSSGNIFLHIALLCPHILVSKHERLNFAHITHI